MPHRSSFPSDRRSGFFLALAAAFTLVLGLVADAGPAPAPVGEPAALAQLIRDYLETEDGDRADQTLARIVEDPGADLSRVETLIKTSRLYREEPVGLQPSVPVRVGSRTFTFGLYVPPSYRPAQAYGLVVCLHGAGFTGDAYLERWKARLGDQYILACPTFIQGTWWTRAAEELVLATIRTVEARYHIDPDRILLTGMSNGGIGTWLIGVHHAALFAGIAPMASGLDEVLYPFLENLRATPAYIIHGAKDQVMPVELSRALVKELTRLGYPFVYREHERVHPMAGGHFFPREELPELVAWFGARKRTPFPNRLTVVRDATHLTPFGWVRIDATDRIAAFTDLLTDTKDETVVKRLYARLEAEVVAPNRIEVRTQRVRRYTLLLNQALVDWSKPLTVLTNGRMSYQGMVAPSVATMLQQARVQRERSRLFPAVLTIVVEGEP
ncbi:carboxylesterase family protein [Nitrospira sp. Kam-Ns4a]